MVYRDIAVFLVTGISRKSHIVRSLLQRSNHVTSNQTLALPFAFVNMLMMLWPFFCLFLTNPFILSF